MNATETTSTPYDFGLILPSGWIGLDLNPLTRRESIDRIAGRLGDDESKRRELADLMLKSAVEAHRKGARRAWAFSQELDGTPVVATLLASFWAPGDGKSPETAETIAGRLRRQSERAAQPVAVSTVDLPAGSAARIRRKTTVTPAEAGHKKIDLHALQFFVPVPKTTAVLVLAFSTPVTALADEFTELFDAIAGTVHWRDGAGRE